jgi:hypothetical protein
MDDRRHHGDRVRSPLRFRNHHRLAAPPPGARVVEWASDNPATGRLVGRFVVVGDTIWSSFQSAARAATGSERLTYVAPDRYQARGSFLASAAVVSTWSMDLVRNDWLPGRRATSPSTS